MITIRPSLIPGRWREGYALDLHTESSTHVGDDEYGHPQFETKRSPAGELLFRIKYRLDRSAVPELVECAAAFVRSWHPPIDMIVPVPPTRVRALQPDIALGEALVKDIGVDFCGDCVRRTKEVPELLGRRVRADRDPNKEQTVTKVFVGGSRRIRRLNEEIRRRIDRIIAKRFHVLVGDANGADKAVQRYLHNRRYERVRVFCVGGTPRNNVGGWPLQVVRPPHSSRDFDYYACKDRVMATEATVGLMIWDGESRGTLLNILRLLSQGKAVVVHVGPKKAFAEVRSMRGFEDLASTLDREAARRLHEQAVSEGLADAAAYQANLGF